MAELRPFRALRPTAENAARVASVPYDVVSAAEARELAAGNPDSFLHVVRPEIDLPEGTDEHDDAVYAKAAENLAAFRARGALVEEERPCLYLYRIVMGEHAQTGIVGAFSVEEYDTDEILKHEHTRPGKEADRTRHVRTLAAQAGPVFLTFRPAADVEAQVRAGQAADPLFDFTAPDGVRHTVWRVDAPDALVGAFAAVEPLYVADGHHRSAARLQRRRERREAGTLGPDDPAHRFLAVAFPTDQVQILPYNRLVHDLGGRSPEAFLAAVGEATGGPLRPADSATPPRGEARLYVAGGWHAVPLTPAGDDPVARLDVQALQDRVLGPVLGITDPRRDERLSFVGGIRGPDALALAVTEGRAQAAVSLPAVAPDELLAVADAGLTMPPKSTWFEPKLRSGLLTYPI